MIICIIRVLVLRYSSNMILGYYNTRISIYYGIGVAGVRVQGYLGIGVLQNMISITYWTEVFGYKRLIAYGRIL